MVERRVKSCIPCQASLPETKREPLKMSPLPTAPWTDRWVKIKLPQLMTETPNRQDMQKRDSDNKAKTKRAADSKSYVKQSPPKEGDVVNLQSEEGREIRGIVNNKSKDLW